MASEDVIELGSSDEETRPAKKIKAGPNAMVHIPNVLHGVTIKPTKSAAGTGGAKGSKFNKTNNSVSHPNRNIAKTNGKKTLVVPQKSITIRTDLQKGIPIVNKVTTPLNVNPVTLMKKLNNSQLMVNKLSSPINVLTSPIPVKGGISVKRGPIKLPSTITVKKTLNSKRPATTNVTGVKKKQKRNTAVREVLTIDSDDEEAGKEAAKPSGPQWYLRPEEQEDTKKQEEDNNAEPDTSKYIEITIEDSPVKPVKDKRTFTVGTELAITIDDSPVKPKETLISDKNKDTGSTPHSKKKLDYPVETFEIEIEPMEIGENYVPTENVQDPMKDSLNNTEETETNKECFSENKTKATGTAEESVVFEVAESPAKKNDSPVRKPKEVPIMLKEPPSKSKEVSSKSKEAPSNSNEAPSKTQEALSKTQEAPSKTKEVPSKSKEAPIKVIDLDLEDDCANSEFHPVYQQFIDQCLKIEDSVDMKTIVEKKIKSYYRQVPKEYTESEEFLDLVSGKILSMKAGPEKVYLYIKDIVDELNMQRKLAKQQILSETNKKSAEEEKFLYGKDNEFDSKRQRQIRKLEKTLKKLHRAIQKLEEQEVDFDDEEDSVYLLTERYKERMVRVHAKLCQLTNTKMPSEPRVQIDARPGQPSGPAKRLEKWINKKVPIGTPLPFPDFHDVLRCVRDANDEDKLGWNEADIMEEARDLFVRCGKKLQRRRQENEWRLAVSRISVDVDPAEQNEVLKKKLEENKQLATKKETEVFNKYADRQSMLKLEAEVVGDKEADESPVESEEEEPVDDSCTMKNKERRKERLRRLLQEKPRHSDKNENPQKETDLNEVSEEINKDILDNVTEASVEKEKENKKSEEENESQKENKDENEDEKVHSISDSSDNVGSDVDELHLLQKLHSGNEVDSSSSASSDSLMDISDTIQSDNEKTEKTQSEDVISIENSSYSDSERSNDAKNDKTKYFEAVKSSMTTGATQEKDEDVVGNKPDMGQVLTVSDEDRHSKDDNESQESDVASTNTQDDAIFIGDTEVQGIKNTTQEKDEDVVGNKPDMGQVLTVSDEDRHSKDDNESQESDVACTNTQDDAISIGDTEVQGIKNTTTTCDVIESDSNSPELESSIIASCLQEQKNTDDEMFHEINQSSIELKTPSNTDSGFVNDAEDLETKVDDVSDLNKKSDNNERNENQKTSISNEPNLSSNKGEIILCGGGSQNADLSTEVTETKVDDKNIPSKCQKMRENKMDNECVVTNESNLSFKGDKIVLNKIDTQNKVHENTETSNDAEKFINNCKKPANTDSCSLKIDEFVEQSCPKVNTETLSSKVADASENTLALSNETNSKTDLAESNIAFKDTDISYKNKNSEFKENDSLENILEELRSDLEAN